MTAPGHTPGPWYIKGDYIREESTDATIAKLCADDGHCDKKHRRDMPADANAAHIVSCVNAHDGLVEALKSAMASMEQLVKIGRIPQNNQGLRDARQALAALESGPNGEG